MAPTAEVAPSPIYHISAVDGGLHAKSPPYVKVSNVKKTDEPTLEVEPRTIDELMRSRARYFPDEKILGYPDENGQYVEYTYRELDTFAFQVAQHYAKFIPQRSSSSEKERVVGLLGASNLDYLIASIALSKLGFTVLFLSTRISHAAYQSLLESTMSQHLLVDDSFLKMADKLRGAIPSLSVTKIATVSELQRKSHPTESDTRLDSSLDLDLESKKISWIIHSSGSTGLPKPIYQTHSAALCNYRNNLNMKGFITLPLFHAHGISSVFRAFTSRKSIYLYNARLPLAQTHLLSIMQQHDFEIFYGVPYALKLLGESQEGIGCLAKMKVVMFGGSACPDSLGDRLVDAGINLVSHYGTTETGQLMTSFRDHSDKVWNYVRPSSDLKPYLHWDHQGGDIYELVVLKGWRSLVASNHPNGSYATKDLFVRHPTVPNAWKYFARLDDTIVLLNGEKCVPTDIEQAVRVNQIIQEAVIVGSGRPQLGMLVIPSRDVSAAEVLKETWPTIEKCNVIMPAYAQLTKDMVHILPSGSNYPQTDKGTVIRQAFYKKFEVEIETLFSSSDDSAISGNCPTSEEEIRALLRDNMNDLLDLSTSVDDGSDFFSLGMDSLQATRFRRAILKSLPVKTSALGLNVVFDFPTINALTAELRLLQQGLASEIISPEQQMQDLIQKYETFPPHIPRENPVDGQYLVITGATGSLGAHIIAQLASRTDIRVIYCLVRAKSNSEARHRVIASLRERLVYHGLPLLARQKIIALPSDLSKADLGLGWEMYDAIARNLTSLIHCAWSVNFNLNLSSFEKDCIAGTRHLMLLCLAVKRPSPASFSFCSSISAVAATPGGHVAEALPVSLSCAQGMGYAQSKLVTEHLVKLAAEQTGMATRILRVGQIVADTQYGVWNVTEAIPLMLQAGVTIGAIPALDESPLWLPVDVVGKAIGEIALSDFGSGVMNVVAPQAFHWTRDLLPKLHKAGLQFEELGQREWIKQLRDSNSDANVNPPIKLLNFFASKYDNDNTVRRVLQYDTSLAKSLSPSLASAAALDQALVDKFVARFQATSWRPIINNRITKPPRIIVVAGPCGSGKTTIATKLAATLKCPYIEGDSYHDASALEKMSSNVALTDDDRWVWLERLRKVASFSVQHAPSRTIALTCSALKPEYRDILREIEGVEMTFILLQVNDEKKLVERLATRRDHYMKGSMVHGQVEELADPTVREVDVVPIDASQSPESVFADIMDLI